MAKKALRIAVLLIFVCSVLLLVGCKDNSLEGRTKEVEQLVKRRYILTERFEDFQVYPLYNELNELAYFLVDFEPTGFLYVRINKDDPFYVTFFKIRGRYTRASHLGGVDNNWRRYRVVTEEVEPEPYEDRQWLKDDSMIGYSKENYYWEASEYGKFYYYTDSHFKVANIQNEKRYLLEIKNSGYFIPAVKRGDKYLNLISMEEFEYNETISEKTMPSYSILFSAKSHFDL